MSRRFLDTENIKKYIEEIQTMNSNWNQQVPRYIGFCEHGGSVWKIIWDFEIFLPPLYIEK